MSETLTRQEQSEEFRVPGQPKTHEKSPDTRIAYEPVQEDFEEADRAALVAVKFINLLERKSYVAEVDEVFHQTKQRVDSVTNDQLASLDPDRLDNLAFQTQGNIDSLLREKENLEHIRDGYNRTITIGGKKYTNDPSVKYRVETSKLKDAIKMIENFVAGQEIKLATYKALAIAKKG